MHRGRRHQCKTKPHAMHLRFLLVLAPVAFGNGLNGAMINRVAWRQMADACFCSPTQAGDGARLLGARRPLAAAANGDMAGTPSPTFYQRLHSPKHILAPMVAQSDLPFRLMCEQLGGVDLSYTQMIHAVNFIQPNGETFRAGHLDVYPQSIVRDILLGKEAGNILSATPSQLYALKGLGDDEIERSRKRILAAIARSRGSESLPEIKPTVVQIASHDPDVAVEAAMMILERSGSMANSGASPPVAAIDLNLGCPQSIARKGRYGSFLHDESPDLTYRVLTKLRSELPREIGVTAKIRLPPTRADADAGKLGNLSSLDEGPQTIDERMRRLIDCGVDLITVHGRTRFENKVAVGAADWDAVRQCVDAARAYSGDEHFPVFANGGIESWNDVQRCLDRTNASGVMSSEGLLELPGLFCSGEGGVASGVTARELLDRQLGWANTYLDYCTLFSPLPGSLGTKGGSFNVIRSHLFKFLHRYLEEQPDLRSWLGNHELNTINQARDLVADLRSRYGNIDEEQLRLKSSWSDDSSWYRRHRGQHTSRMSESTSLSIEERKLLAKLRIRKMQEERIKRSINSV